LKGASAEDGGARVLKALHLQAIFLPPRSCRLDPDL
jgi:hypothetical protein